MPFLLLGEAVKAQHELLKGSNIDEEEPQRILRIATEHAFYFLPENELKLFQALESVVREHIFRCMMEQWKKPKLDPKVYFVRSTEGLIKIGFTTKPIEERLAQFRNISSGGAFLILAIAGSKQDESFLHRTFKKDKAHGEWFNPSKRLLKTIDRLKRGTPILEAVKD